MAIYAISDLHLSLGTDKPMDIFGWGNHARLLQENWLREVKDEDYVLIPGDISWGINLEESDPDLAFIEALPGKKILSKGNHDYWWSTRNKFIRHCEANGYKSLHMLHNNAVDSGRYAVCGSRGWKPTDDEDFSEKDRKIFNRELERLKLSLTQGRKMKKEIIAMLHYPPFDSEHKPNEFGSMLKEFGVRICIYGHVHGKANELWKNEVIEGIRYHLVSCNIVDFKPVELG